MKNKISDERTAKLVKDIAHLLTNVIDRPEIEPGKEWDRKLVKSLSEGPPTLRLLAVAIEQVIDSDEWKEATSEILQQLST